MDTTQLYSKKENHFEGRIEDLLKLAHDLNSPLVVLTDMAEEQKDNEILQAIVQSMNEITKGLLQKKNVLELKNDLDNIQLTENSKINLKILVEMVLRQKRIEFQHHPGLMIESELSSHLVSINPAYFKRLLSNLINNSAEAMNFNGTIRLKLSNESLTIEDSGPGFPKDILNQLGKTPITKGKKNGHGLGLFHAIKLIKSWGFSFTIINRPNKTGTIFTIHFSP